jgi:RNA polymerase-binding transcription factor DksA
MKEQQIKYYRQRLLSLKRRLGSDLSALEEEALRGLGGEFSGGLSDVPIHPADLGTDSHEEEIALGLLRNQDEILTEINDALARIERGTFGQCEECQQEQGTSRSPALCPLLHSGCATAPWLIRTLQGWATLESLEFFSLEGYEKRRRDTFRAGNFQIDL